MHCQMIRWILAVAIAGMDTDLASGVCQRAGPLGLNQPVLSATPGRSHVPLACSAPPPKNPIPVDVGKGIEAKLDQLLDAIKSLTLYALKAAYFQGALHGVLATALFFAILLAFTRRGAP